MTSRRFTLRAAAFVAATMTATSCSSPAPDRTPVMAPTPAQTEVPMPSTTVAPAPTTTAAPDLLIGAAAASLDDVVKATVRIESKGTFAQPAGLDIVNASREAGSGSGFFIDTSGHIVTGSQVVQGATSVEVFVYGEETPRVADVVSVNECSGIAVLTVAGVAPRHLEWYDADRVRRDLGVFAAGFESTEGAYLESPGKVEIELASISTAWKGPGAGFGHDAYVPDGMAGGPLVDIEGRVVGISAPQDTSKGGYVEAALFAGVAIPQVADLINGKTEEIGLNGQVVVTDTGFTGVWVTAVKAGSHVANIGIRAGDIITEIAGPRVPATRTSQRQLGTMDKFCRVMSNAIEDDTLDQFTFKVVRYATGESFVGRTTLERLGATYPGAPIAWVSNDDFMNSLQDQFKNISPDIPVAWSDRRIAPTAVDQQSASLFIASTDVEDFENTQQRTAPGFRAVVSSAYAQDKYTLEELIASAVERTGVDETCEKVTTTRRGIENDPTGRGTQLVAAYEGCGADATKYMFEVGYMVQASDADPVPAGYIVEVHTVHEIMSAWATEMIARTKITGWP